MAPGFAHHPPGKTLTLAEFKEGGAFVHRAFADYTLTIDELIVSGDNVAVRWTASGTHVGSFFGEAPTGRRVAVQGMTMHHVSAGRITDDFEVIDLAGLRTVLQMH
jgi:predicted ester cyclase